MILGASTPRRLARLVDALADEILGAPDDEVVASDSSPAFLAAAASIRRALDRTAAGLHGMPASLGPAPAAGARPGVARDGRRRPAGARERESDT